MRQLRRTGWLPNRARMIVASFLTKDLSIDWRSGERHFMANSSMAIRPRTSVDGNGRHRSAVTAAPSSGSSTR